MKSSVEFIYVEINVMLYIIREVAVEYALFMLINKSNAHYLNRI